MKHEYLSSAHEGTEEYPFQRPLGFGNGDIWFCPSDINRGNEESRHRTLSAADDGVYEVPELQV